MIELGDRDIVMSSKPVLERAQNLPFVFEGMRMLYMDFQGEQAEDSHGRVSQA